MLNRAILSSAAMAIGLGFAAMGAVPAFTATAEAQSRGYLQCVPYARELSGVQIYGNANTWWRQAEGRYERGQTPREGAVMVFNPHRGMRYGHVAYVSKVVDSRTVRLSHANWSRINGRRGQIERDVPAIDVSPNNDWSEVRVWYHSMGDLGITHWPLAGFIYNDGADTNALEQPPIIANAPATTRPSRVFLNAFSPYASDK